MQQLELSQRLSLRLETERHALPLPIALLEPELALKTSIVKDRGRPVLQRANLLLRGISPPIHLLLEMVASALKLLTLAHPEQAHALIISTVKDRGPLVLKLAKWPPQERGISLKLNLAPARLALLLQDALSAMEPALQRL